MNGTKKCVRQGCNKNYTDDANNEDTCKYHDGKPIFHDLKKGWTCCNVIVYDWDEFTNIKGCKTAAHSNIKESNTDFFRSQTVDNAQKGIDTNPENITKVENPPQIKEIKDYEEIQNKLKEEKRKLDAEKPKEIIKNSEGKHFCSNPGCADKTFVPENNGPDACKHHAGPPIFHDRKKMWTCCKQEAFDWDDFMKLDPCIIGPHTTKYKN